MSSYQPKVRSSTKKQYTCADCGKTLLPKDAFSYVDGCNCSITANAPILCAECYAIHYQEHDDNGDRDPHEGDEGGFGISRVPDV